VVDGCCLGQVLDTFLAHGLTADRADFLDRLTAWVNHGFWGPDRQIKRAMGIGQTVFSVIQAHSSRNPTAAKDVWERSGRKLAANGAVMRTSITAVPHFNDLTAVIADTVVMAQTTHHDPRSVASCIAVAVVLSSMLQRVSASDPASDYSGDSASAAHSWAIPPEDVNRVIETGVECANAWLDEQRSAPEFSADPESPKGAGTPTSWTGFSFTAAQRELREYTSMTSLTDLKLDDPPTIGYTYKCLGSAVACLRSLASTGVAVDATATATTTTAAAGDAMPVLGAAVSEDTGPPGASVLTERAASASAVSPTASRLPAAAAAASKSAPGFVAAICDLVAEGGDADTNAAVAGALMGCLLGYDALVEQVKHLKWHVLNHANDLLEPRLARLQLAMGLVDGPMPTAGC
jgi:ADP-ribosylglycohydrolase